MEDSDNNPLLDSDIQDFFESKWISWNDYSFTIERHFLWDGKHRIIILYKNKSEEIDINSWDSEDFLVEVLEELIK